eukprot:12187941-Heterocapsa_arctica.AAC.1
MEKEGFVQVFRRRSQDAREEPSGHGTRSEDPGPRAPEFWNQGRQDEEADDTTGTLPRGQAARASSSPKDGSFTPVPTSNRYAHLAESIRAEE